MFILANRDISQRNFEKIPVTDAKRGTVINNLDPLDSWICSKAMEGGFRLTGLSGTDDFRSFGKDDISATELYQLYITETKGKGCSSFIGFMMLLKKKLPSLTEWRRHTSNGNEYALPPQEQVIADIRNTIGVDLSPDMSLLA